MNVWQYCKEQYCIGTCDVRSMNQGKLDMVKQEMARVNIDILGINDLKWTGMGELNSDDHYIYYCRQESLRRNGVALIVNKRVRNEVLGCNLKNNRMISGPFQGICVNLFKEKFLNPLCDDSRGVWLILCFSRCRSEFPTFPPLQNCEFFGSFHYFNPVFLYIIICIWDYNTVTI